MTEDQREELKQQLADTMMSQDWLLMDAIWEGRVGLNQLTDAELLLEAEIWGVEVPK